MSEPRRFRSMGCEVVVGGAGERAAAAIEALFAAWDARFSRFRDDSELCRVNRSPAGAVEVSAPFADTVRAALRAWRATSGLVDPTLLDALEHSGYDADFAALPADRRAARGSVPGSRAADVRLSGRLLVRPPGLRLDLAGVVKGRCVDAAVALLDGPGWVSAGGDLATTRPVDVAVPVGESVRLQAGALATSSSRVRRWRCGGREQHHLIDPRTGAPAMSRWAYATVCGATCEGADIAAKAAFLLGDDALDWLDERGLPGRLVDRDGTVAYSAAWRAMVGEATACT